MGDELDIWSLICRYREFSDPKTAVEKGKRAAAHAQLSDRLDEVLDLIDRLISENTSLRVMCVDYDRKAVEASRRHFNADE